MLCLSCASSAAFSRRATNGTNVAVLNEFFLQNFLENFVQSTVSQSHWRTHRRSHYPDVWATRKLLGCCIVGSGVWTIRCRRYQMSVDIAVWVSRGQTDSTILLSPPLSLVGSILHRRNNFQTHIRQGLCVPIIDPSDERVDVCKTRLIGQNKLTTILIGNWISFFLIPKSLIVEGKLSGGLCFFTNNVWDSLGYFLFKFPKRGLWCSVRRVLCLVIEILERTIENWTKNIGLSTPMIVLKCNRRIESRSTPRKGLTQRRSQTSTLVYLLRNSSDRSVDALLLVISYLLTSTWHVLLRAWLDHTPVTMSVTELLSKERGIKLLFFLWSINMLRSRHSTLCHVWLSQMEGQRDPDSPLAGRHSI